MNRVAGTSKAFSDYVDSVSIGWVLVSFFLVFAFFLGGYLIQRHLQEKKRNKDRFDFE